MMHSHYLKFPKVSTARLYLSVSVNRLARLYFLYYCVFPLHFVLQVFVFLYFPIDIDILKEKVLR